ncbi:MAG: hypothetical protein US68_C0003G0035 [Candidatus Shapirobacteria bacterium GW2011_GWE1_38_10]|uniref:Uncharacterized protein n=1 Tax=Candidatus Shapirobacteria bacterium GW2011_GWE1_38_10 TaxID=1618488 RepID=A0A0G0KNC3_9BACT|nr:MAG: hypothetical protein US46_C0008G0005 [Candidatus Shapirobacteria bacterium GW2011_GWF2_37_20]KKQ50669.1 MAG: hypothetical protein US68_C0003G0035 [Candidatus Shapirobacteria bacterium GW2011_GWE1_38_10]KKQ64380.1 MAG: hypothetical protein US85_C0010G0012 [Candidatus Shapirobacteria bacterium GW2011_GWF1_38_23]
MIKKRVKNLFRLTALISVRQGYFLGRNWYELMREPYLTIKALRESRDKSQIFLISLTALAPLFLYVILRIIYDLIRYRSLLIVTGGVFKLAVFIQGLILVYLGYWVIKVFQEE